MNQLLRLGAAASLALAAACSAPETSTEPAALAAENGDTSLECEGILTYVNWASYAELAPYLPNSLATAIVARRNVTPFVSMADLSSVSGVAQGRLEQIYGRAATLDFTDEDCVGVFEEHAVSWDHKNAILAFVNGASLASLHNAVPNNEDAVPYLMSTRPYTNLAALAATPQVGIATFHAIKVAAIDGPFEQLAAAVNEAEQDVFMTTDFNWFSLLFGAEPGYPTHLECWGLDDEVTEQHGQIRPYLADDDEVVAAMADAVAYADRFDEVGPDPAAGLADLAAWAEGRTFYGCYATYAPDPWSGVIRRYYVDTVTNTGVYAEIRWSE
jgi:hypothetical protein